MEEPGVTAGLAETDQFERNVLRNVEWWESLDMGDALGSCVPTWDRVPQDTVAAIEELKAAVIKACLAADGRTTGVWKLLLLLDRLLFAKRTVDTDSATSANKQSREAVLERIRWAWRGDWGLLWDDAHCLASSAGGRTRDGDAADEGDALKTTAKRIEALVAAGEWQKAAAMVSAAAPLCTDEARTGDIEQKFPSRPAGQALPTAPALPTGAGGGGVLDAQPEFWGRIRSRTKRMLR
eukprot:8907275-Alexandrium_andersonii.AAC.1